MSIRRKLNSKHNKLLKEYTKDPTITTSIEAVYGKDNVINGCSNTGRLLRSSNIRLQMKEELAKRGFDIGALAESYIQLVKANKVIYATSNGEISDTMEVPDNPVRKSTLDSIAEIVQVKGNISNDIHGNENVNILTNLSDDQLRNLIHAGAMIDTEYSVEE